ncbi:MAG TPA: hypothetical protein VFX95_01520 [Caulobacteraceae bacterium]|nr:hypothetical protein [Caulobacteraceae bacterium]
MGRKSEAAVLAAQPERIDVAEPVAELPPQPARWSIPRMLAVSAVISAGIWAVIIAVVITAAG